MDIMKITKRQLKQIIREEYSRLKQRGLIKESRWSAGDPDEEYSQERVDRMVMFLDDLMENDPDLASDEDSIFHALNGHFANASEEEIADAMASF